MQAHNSLRIPSSFDKEVPSLPHTLVEQRMDTLSSHIREKPEWWKMIQDDETIAGWRAEIRDEDQTIIDELWSGREYWYHRYPESPDEGDTEEERELVLYRIPRWTDPKQWPRDPISDVQLDYVFDRLLYDAGKVDRPTGIYPTAVHGVYESRTLISPELRDSFLNGIATLDEPIHPSLYPLRIGHSTVVRWDLPNHPVVVQILTEEVYSELRPDLLHAPPPGKHFISKNYQWLPTDFLLSPPGSNGELTATPLGYINNLHPKRHLGLYRSISAILARFVPLWERVLTDQVNGEPLPVVPVDPATWYDGLPEPPAREDKAACEAYEREARWPFIPEPDPFVPPTSEEHSGVKLGGRTLQVVISHEEAFLTPEEDPLLGRSLHLAKSVANERIVAMGVYCYAADNAAESHIVLDTVVGDTAFRGFGVGDDDAKGYGVAFGLQSAEPERQERGRIALGEGRCVAFPSVYGTHVLPLELADKGAPGHRKCLYFFLVDPDVRIPSTTDVLPQQEEWATGELATVDMRGLPRELRDMVAEWLRAGTMTRAEAEEVREKMEEEHFELLQFGGLERSGTHEVYEVYELP